MAIIDLRYAHALAAVVAEQKLDPRTVVAELKDFTATLEGSHELRQVLENPAIAERQKLGVLDAIAAKAGMSKTVRNTVALIAANQRLSQMGAITEAFAAIADSNAQVTDAEVTSAHTLGEHERGLLEQTIAKLAGGQSVRATYKEDAGLLGGAVIRIGSTVYDGSVKTQLERMKQKLMAATA